ncbi:TetR/AcrR family transcriptional regulator [Enterococcus hirae]|nr:TetR/AcrR family transcriptional regulator [Enterococcus hirae]
MKNIVSDPQKVARILRAAMNIFGESGYTDSSTNRIAQEAEVSKGLIFHYFGSKSELYIDTYHDTYTRIYAAMDRRIWTDAEDLVKMVTQATRYKISLQLAYPAEFRFFLQAYRDLPHLPEPLREKMQQELKQVNVLGEEIISETIEKMPLRAGVERKNVIFLVSAVVASETAKVADLLAAGGKYQRIEDFQPIIDSIRAQLDIIEHGFAPKDVES